MPDWPHAPPHRLFERGAYMVTASTLHKAHYFNTSDRLNRLQDLLLRTLARGDWRVQAWAVFSNHYHFVAFAPSDPDSLGTLLNAVHGKSALALNQMDQVPNRQVWFQFWDTKLTYRTSYFTRLRYVHENAVRHGVVARSVDYPWCSAGWLEQTGEPGLRRLLASFNTSQLSVYDEFDVPPLPPSDGPVTKA